MSNPSKQMVFATQNPLWVISGELQEHTFSTLLSGHCFCCALSELLRFGVPKRTPKCADIFGFVGLKNGPHHQKAPKGVRSPAQDIQKPPKWSPRAPK